MTDRTAIADAAPASTAGAHPNTAAKVIAPIATFAASWGIRKVMESTYQKRTGNAPPNASDPEVSLRRAIVWAVATAAALAVVNVFVDRMTSKPRKV